MEISIDSTCTIDYNIEQLQELVIQKTDQMTELADDLATLKVFIHALKEV